MNGALALAVCPPGHGLSTFKPPNRQFVTFQRSSRGVLSTVESLQDNAMPSRPTAPIFPAILSKRNSFRQLTQLAFFFRAPGAMATAQAPPKLATIRLYAAAARYMLRRLF
ncbi:hypothetical protein [Janthinobacterium sp. DSP2-3-3]|uniref:hypothetical protein n=1 Tax=unclassified Janthinobacterium TaxID=2610881 RepID=UPI003CF039DD